MSRTAQVIERASQDLEKFAQIATDEVRQVGGELTGWFFALPWYMQLAVIVGLILFNAAVEDV